MRNILRLLLSCALLAALGLPVRAQFREEAFSQQYNDNPDSLGRDSTETMFSFKEFFGGIRHTEEARIGTMFAGSTVFIGAQQMHNRQYWKLPVIYGGLAATTGLGIHYGNQYRKTGDAHDKTMRTLMFAGAGAVYWGALLDGAVHFPTDNPHHPGKATIYSILLPGLGQAYNGEYWKIPVYYTGLLVSASLVIDNNTNYRRYQRIYREATDEEVPYEGPIQASTAQYYRNIFRRYRDYSIVAVAAFYLLQIIDANVFAYMQDFEVNDDLSLHIGPTLLPQGSEYAFGPSSTAFGMSLGLRF